MREAENELGQAAKKEMHKDKLPSEIQKPWKIQYGKIRTMRRYYDYSKIIGFHCNLESLC